MKVTEDKEWTRTKTIELTSEEVEEFVSEKIGIKGNNNVFEWNDLTGDVFITSRSTYPDKGGS